jgi:endonuclease/exonuclease/phosphatase family metal-dependent hydrolase
MILKRHAFAAAAMFCSLCLLDGTSPSAAEGPNHIAPASGRDPATDTLRVMSFNIWRGGEAGKLPLEQTVKVIQAARADLVGIQESHGEERDGKRPDAARAIAKMLSWHHFDQGDEDNAVVSRFPIVAHSPKKMGVAVELPGGRRAWIFNVHLAHAPYQPYQLLKIPYADAPFIEGAEQAVRAANRARRHQIRALLKEVDGVRGEKTPIFITGDFNEPSGLDWTEAVWRDGRCPVAVAWPTTAAVHDAKFHDAYRSARPDPLQSPGLTWTPTTAENDPHDRHDRIDFVFVGGANVRVDTADVVGERRERADIVVAPYPSDHRAVVATVIIE